MQLAIIAGGKGTRLRSRIGDLPKPLAPVAGKPLLQHQIEMAAAQGVRDIVVLTGYGAAAIREFCGDGSRWGASVQFHEETSPLGTAGCVLEALDLLPNEFIVLYGDTMLDIDLNRFLQYHRQSGAEATLLAHPNDHPQDSDLLAVDERGIVRTILPYPHPEGAWLENLVNAAAYVLDKPALAAYRERFRSGDFAKHLFPLMLADGRRIAAYRSTEYIKDAGTPERLDKVEADFLSGRIAQGRAPRPAVFLDRDGTLTASTDLVIGLDQLELLPGAAEAVRAANRAGYLAVLVTNQPVIARGDCTVAELRILHSKLETLLGREGAYLDKIYYCPHHPDGGYPGERPELKIECECRKPQPGMILQAADEPNIDLARSWLVGDSTMDTLTAHNAGIRSALVATGNGGADGRYQAEPTFRTADAAAAVARILS
ncbi:MAG TPA: HAD-IIIA family hydrolase [Armatimonadota bacterium]|jgi:D,D-heptose 1,7-bisphosphate phosphatase